MKRALYDADAATLAPTLPTVPTLDSTAAPWRPEKPVSADDVTTVKKARVAVLRDAARRANAYGGAPSPCGAAASPMLPCRPAPTPRR